MNQETGSRRPLLLRSACGPRAAFAALMAVLTAVACSDSTGTGNRVELQGPAVTIGNGTARTVVVKQGNTVTSIGVRLTAGVLAGLPPATPGTAWDLALPSGVSVPPWDHVSIDWNPQGHPPPGIYTVPHFDIHFYMITPSEQAAIQGGPDTTTVAPSFIPKDYASQVMAVPMMGVHWADTLAAEYHGQPFDHTLIYGFYRGKMVFIEPMVTQAFLQGGADFTGTVKRPAAYQKPGLYPRSYSIRHDAAANTITVSLDSLSGG